MPCSVVGMLFVRLERRCVNSSLGNMREGRSGRLAGVRRRPHVYVRTVGGIARCDHRYGHLLVERLFLLWLRWIEVEAGRALYIGQGHGLLWPWLMHCHRANAAFSVRRVRRHWHYRNRRHRRNGSACHHHSNTGSNTNRGSHRWWQSNNWFTITCSDVVS